MQPTQSTGIFPDAVVLPFAPVSPAVFPTAQSALPAGLTDVAKRAKASPAPGTPYHQLARTSDFRWWRPLLATLVAAILIAVFFIGTMVAIVTPAALAGAFDTTTGESSNAAVTLAVNLLPLAALLPAIAIARLVWRLPIGTLSSVTGGLRWRWMRVCGALAAVLMVADIIARIVLALVVETPTPTPDDQITWPALTTIVASLLVVLALVPLQAAAEEFVFRGWLLQFFGGFFRNKWVGAAIGILLSSLAFMAAHGYQTWLAVDIFVFGVIACILTLKTGGLEAAIALHVANNIVLLGLSAVVGGVNDSLDQGQTSSLDWIIMTVNIVMMIMYTAVVLILARKRNLQTVA